MKLALGKRKARVLDLAPPEDEQAEEGTAAVHAPEPPSDPDVRLRVERLAEFVARNGPTFEELTRSRTAPDASFTFLRDPGCSEHAYYQSRLAALRVEAAARGAALWALV
jgi:hypothetical protein